MLRLCEYLAKTADVEAGGKYTRVRCRAFLAAAGASSARSKGLFYGAEVSNLGHDRCALAQGATQRRWSSRSLEGV